MVLWAVSDARRYTRLSNWVRASSGACAPVSWQRPGSSDCRLRSRSTIPQHWRPSSADTVGGATAAALFAKVRNGGAFGYASVLPDGVAQQNPSVTVTRVFARPDASKVREFADDIRDGKFVLPIGHRLPLRDAGAAQTLAEKGGARKVVLVCR